MSADFPRERAEQRTVLLPRHDAASALPPGFKLQEYVVQRLLGGGGHSTVYLAHDTRLDRRVALKEYLPTMLAHRAPGGEVTPRLPRFTELYQQGLQGFINEARLLCSFDHPSLVKVHRFWAENGTAYMAMPYYEGVTLKRWLADLGAPPSERWLRQLATPLMEALAAMHARQCYHRDVAPDNILMLYDRSDRAGYLAQRPQPVLLDFGAARRVIGDATQTLTAILKSGYSPVEQYDSGAAQRQGAWTDVYALSAVLYTAAIGRPPGSSIARLVRDDQSPAVEAGRGRYSETFLAGIDAGLSVRPEHRPQTMGALRRRLDGVVMPPPAATSAPTPLDEMPTGTLPSLAQMRAAAAAEKAAPGRSRTLWFALVAAVMVVAVLVSVVWLRR